jgi:hypothetical protein
MQRLDINGNLYLIKKAFPFNRIKNEEALFEIKGFYGADYLIKENNSQIYYLVQKIDEATILEETENT